MSNPYRGVVVMRQPTAAAGEAAPRLFPIYDAYKGLTSQDQKDAFVKTIGRTMRIETQKLLDELYAAVPARTPDALYAWGRANDRNIDMITQHHIDLYAEMERKGATRALETDILRGWVDTTRSGARIPLDLILPADARGVAGEPATGGRRRKSHRTRRTRRHRRM
jgi:hypothetical protein